MPQTYRCWIPAAPVRFGPRSGSPIDTRYQPTYGRPFFFAFCARISCQSLVYSFLCSLLTYTSFSIPGNRLGSRESGGLTARVLNRIRTVFRLLDEYQRFFQISAGREG